LKAVKYLKKMLDFQMNLAFMLTQK